MARERADSAARRSDRARAQRAAQLHTALHAESLERPIRCAERHGHRQGRRLGRRRPCPEKPADCHRHRQLSGAPKRAHFARAGAVERERPLAGDGNDARFDRYHLNHVAEFSASRATVRVFVAEDASGSVIDLVAGSTTLGPAKKVLIVVALSGELRQASAQNAEAFVSQAPEIETGRAIDAALFGSSAGTASTPPGLLFGVTPATSAGGKGLDGAAADVAALARAFGTNGVSADGMVIVASPATSTQLRALIGLRFGNLILGSAAVADGVLVGILPSGLAVGYSGAAGIEASKSATAQFEATPTSDLLTGFPVRNAYQEFFTLLRIRCRAAWAALPGGVSVVTGCSW